MPAAFPRSSRLSHAREFDAVYGARVRKTLGPLTLHARPNGLDRHRLGLAIGRGVGSAVRRNRVKRMLREAFRLSRGELPFLDGSGYDLVLSARAHDAMPLSDYRRLLLALAEAAHALARRRASTDRPAEAGG